MDGARTPATNTERHVESRRRTAASVATTTASFCAQALLLQTPTYSPAKALSLTIPGEVQGQNIGFAKPIVLWASPANQGARRMANELADSFAGIVVSDAAEVPDHATHMLLYLCESTFADDALAEQVKAVREARLPIVMAHENDPERGGCVFARFFETTPQEPREHMQPTYPVAGAIAGAHVFSRMLQELVAGGLYRKLAVACFPGRHREAGLSAPAHTADARIRRQFVDHRRSLSRFWPRRLVPPSRPHPVAISGSGGYANHK